MCGLSSPQAGDVSVVRQALADMHPHVRCSYAWHLGGCILCYWTVSRLKAVLPSPSPPPLPLPAPAASNQTTSSRCPPCSSYSRVQNAGTAAINQTGACYSSASSQLTSVNGCHVRSPLLCFLYTLFCLEPCCHALQAL